MREFSEILEKLIEKRDLTSREIRFALQEIINSKINNSQIAAFLTALKIKGEKAEEIAEFVKIMKKKAVKVKANNNRLVDVVGTGGDKSNTFNISTASAFVVAGAGVKVAKHGNKSVSSKVGSADVLEELDINININAREAEKQLNKIGITFLFAPIFHPAMKVIAPIRKDLGFKTIFNIVGPLTNPANAKRGLIGVYSKELLEKIAIALKILGTKKILVVNSDIDEISISESTRIIEVTKNKIKKYEIKPEAFGFKRVPLKEIQITNKRESANRILNVLNGKECPHRNIVLLNAGAALYASGIVKSIDKGISLAENSIDSGKALMKLEELKNYGGHT